MVARRALRAYLVAILVLTFTAAAIIGYRGRVLHRTNPSSSPRFLPGERYSDLYHYVDKCKEFEEGKGFRGGEWPYWIYPAPSAYVQCFLLNHTGHPMLALAMITVAITLLGAYFLVRTSWSLSREPLLVVAVVAGTMLTSYPLLFSLDRGQMEPIMMGLVLLFLVFFILRRYWLSALFLALAVCIKPYAAAFFFILLVRRHFRETAVAVLVFVALNYAGLAGFGTPVAESYQGIQEGMEWFIDERASAIVPTETGFDHGLFSVAKKIGQRLSPETPFETPAYRTWYRPYFFIAAAMGLLMLVRIWKMPFLNQFFALTVAIVLLPWVSYDYTILEVYLPWGLFILFLLENDSRREPLVTLPRAMVILLPCALAFTPQSYVVGNQLAYGGQVKALTLLFLFVATMTFPMPLSLFREIPRAAVAHVPDDRAVGNAPLSDTV